MSFKNKFSIAMTAVVALCSAYTSSASAVYVTKEAGGGDCGIIAAEVPLGACPVRGEATDVELGGIFGAMVTCDVAFEGNINEGGTIQTYFYDVQLCEASSATECTGEGDRHPTFDIRTGSGPWSMEATMCIVAFGTTIRCHVTGTAVEAFSHVYQLNFVHTTKCENSSSNSYQGTFTLFPDSSHPAIELK